MEESTGVNHAGLSRHGLNALIRRLGTQKRPSSAVTISRRSAAAPCPLSYAQERLWFLDQLHPGSAAYNVPGSLRLQGQLDVAALTAALSAVVRRHEVLRSCIALQDGEPVQIPAADARVPKAIALIDLSARGLPLAARIAAAQQITTSVAQQPFDLARGPLLRAVLLRHGQDEHVLVLVLHHIVCDGWSLDILLCELIDLYEAASRRVCPLPSLPIAYSDFAVWQRKTLSGTALDRALTYWRRQLRAVPALALVTDRPRGPTSGQRAATTRRFLMPRPALDALTAIGQQQRATLFMTLLATFQALLHRYTDQTDLSVGTPIAGRTQPQLEGLIGFFANTLVLRADLAGDPSFSTLLGRVRETALAAFEHQEVPFARLVEALAPRRDLATTPFFQVALTVREAPFTARQLPGLRALARAVTNGAPKFELSLELSLNADGLEAALEYDRALFDATTAARLLRHFEVLLDGVVATPHGQLSRLSLLDPAARQLLLVAANDQPPLPTGAAIQGAAIPARIAAQAARHPAATAVATTMRKGSAVLTYGALNRSVEGLARLLRRQGVGPEVRVGVLLDRQPQMVVALLAILRAGGAYVPLDPAYPAARLAYQLQDADVRVVLTTAALRSTLGAFAERALLLEEDRLAGYAAEGERRSLSLAPPAPDSLAYVIYTSGSTGQPKGVQITHRACTALMDWAAATFSAAEFDGVLGATSTCFDLSVFELFAPLCQGGRVVLVEDALALAGLPAGAGVRLLNTVPSALAALLRSGGVPPSVITLNLAGEPWPATLAAEIHQRTAVRRLLNLYGPSEDTTYSTLAAILPGQAGAPPIGKPLAGTQAYVVDGRLSPLPLGAAGELCLGGVGLARGYLGRPAHTATAFVPAPFGPQPGVRLYRTGDRVRYGLAGQLIFLGRIDQQMKVRGFRIEPGEIEASLEAHPAVRRAVVVADEPRPEDRRLVAYVGTGAQTQLTATALQTFLSTRLPAFMVPAAFILLEVLPLTPNGKVDRRALPAPSWRAAAPYEAPRTALEATLAGLWQALLAVERVGVHDDFFALGGHSLLAARLIARLRERLGVEVPLQRLFAGPTVAALAAEVVTVQGVTAQGVATPGRAVVPLQRARRPRQGPVPASSAQARLWFLEQLQSGRATYHIPVALHLEGALHRAALAASFDALARRHETLRTALADAAGQPLQAIAPRVVLPLPTVDLSALPAAQSDGAATAVRWVIARQPFDLTVPPLMRTVVLRRGPATHQLLVVLHHIIADGWSLGVMLHELGLFYGAARHATATKRGVSLVPLALHYADFAVWQRQQEQEGVLAPLLAYWRQQLRGVEPLALPTDRPRPAARREHGTALPVTLPQPSSMALEALARREGATLFVALLAVYTLLLSRYSGQRDVTVGVPVAGRDHSALEGLIGLFVNTLVLRADLAGAASFSTYLRRLQAVSLEAFAHQALPFEQLVEALAADRDLGRTPLFQVMLVLHNTPLVAPALPGLAATAEPLPTGTAKLDLTLSLTATGEGLAATSDGLAGELELDRDLFDVATIARLWGHFTTLAAAAVAHPERPLADLSLLAPEERRQVVETWNATAASLPTAPLHQLVAVQAARTPEAVAVVGTGRCLTYGALVAAAGQLAQRLLAAGVQPEDRVGILMERTPEMVVALLAVLEAGAAYVPLDPSHPPARLADLLRDAQRGVAAPLLISSSFAPQQSGLPEDVARGLKGAHGLKDARGLRDARDLQVLRVDGARPSASPSRPVRTVHLDQAAYAIYTSGSTGQPKGVVNSHRGIANRLLWMCQGFGLGADDAVLQKTPLSFDVSVWELFAPLIAGARLVLARPGGHREPAYLAVRVRAERVTVLHFVPAMLRTFLADPAAGSLGAARVVASGEALTDDLVTAFATRLGEDGATLYNLYGPTEAAVEVTAWPCAALSQLGRVVIGKPIANVRTHVLTESLAPQPVGVPGELYLGGVQVARGYLGCPGLTAVHFVPDPFAPRPAGRLYRSGDRARWLPTGDLDYLGRLDFQVKVRGVRIEPGEIEVALRAQSTVAEAVVVVRQEGGEPRLVAYVVPCTADAELGAQLRQALTVQLPAALVPSAIVMLEGLPQTPSGKIDRRALPAPSWGVEAAYAAPRDALEQWLVALWVEMLGAPKVGIDDDFFQLGGHSLLATQVIAQVREALQVEVPVRRLFETTTVAGLAAAVRQHEGVPGQAETLAGLFLQVKALSPEEIGQRLAAAEATP